MAYSKNIMLEDTFSLVDATYPNMTLREFQQLRDLIYSQTYIFYADHQQALFERKVRPRIASLACSSFQEYYNVLTGPPEGKQEFVRLIENLAVHETSFFRISGHFSGLQHQIFPLLLQKNHGQIRIWSAGCSTGEEPYSIVISFLETLTDQTMFMPDYSALRVIATDISPQAIRKAQEGKYSPKQVKKLQPALLDKYFIYHDNNYYIRDALKQCVKFSVVNLVEIESVFNVPFDIIFCRNVLIYFDRYAQAKLLSRFIEMLPYGGYLFLGDAESIHPFPEAAKHFEFVESGNAIIYQKRGVLFR